MPLYEYKCRDGHLFEKLYLTISAAEAEDHLLQECPVCGKPSMREISAPHAQFVEGCGGFHKPTPGAQPTTHSRKAAEEYIKKMKKDSPGGKLINNTWRPK